MLRKCLLIISLSLFYLSFLFGQKKIDSIKDIRDGKVYRIAKIGNHFWTIDNMQYNTKKGCWIYDDKDVNFKKYGYLYNQQSAAKACPAGWHLPTLEEFETLLKDSGSTPDSVYLKLFNKENGVFQAKYSGLIYYGRYYQLGKACGFWSSTVFNNNYFGYLNLSKVVRKAMIFQATGDIAMSVRCVKNHTDTIKKNK